MSAADWERAGAVQMLRVLWPQGLSTSQIRNALRDIGVCVSRNAVIGKVHRLGLAGRASPHKTYGVAPKRPRKEKLIPPKVRAPVLVKDERESSRKPPAKDASSIRFLDLKPGQCKMFCEGQELSNGLCCGKPASGSWCSNCARTVFNPQAWGAKTRRMA